MGQDFRRAAENRTPARALPGLYDPRVLIGFVSLATCLANAGQIIAHVATRAGAGQLRWRACHRTAVILEAWKTPDTNSPRLTGFKYNSRKTENHETSKLLQLA